MNAKARRSCGSGLGGRGPAASQAGDEAGPNGENDGCHEGADVLTGVQCVSRPEAWAVRLLMLGLMPTIALGFVRE